ncbi:MAG: NUDIX domain-containing protein [Comamonas sp.]|uniref:NUDIX hydrolase n=1 Tax=Comamonas sp. TaxID=34028 RepID=UPI002FC5BCBB
MGFVRPEAAIGVDENSSMRSQTPLHPDKACPVVIRGQGAIEILAFEHPLAGLQLVKGTIETGESSRAAALRELREESGLSASNVSADLGIWTSGYANQIWAFHLCEVDSPLESWIHRTSDDGGHDFKFFWYPLSQQPNEQWHSLFQGALKYIAAKLLV